MRIRTLLGVAVLVAVPSLAAFAQAWNTGVYAELNGGAVMVGEANDVTPDVTGETSLEEGCLSSVGTGDSPWAPAARPASVTTSA